MTYEEKSRWIAALKLGNYKQGKNFLRKNDEYCCLGVLCDLMGVEWHRNDKDPDFSEVYSAQHVTLVKDENSNALLEKRVLSDSRRVIPKTLADKIQLAYRDPNLHLTEANRKMLREKGFPIQYPEVTLAELNDRGVPFDMLAELIREHVRTKD